MAAATKLVAQQLSYAMAARPVGPSLRKALLPMLFAQQASKPAESQIIPLSKNLELRGCSDRDQKGIAHRKQLVLLFSWLMAKRKHINKYGDFYTGQGFDVLNIRITPTQLMWPITGTQVVAEDVLQFLQSHKNYKSLLVHGFSVGGYLYGECLLKMKQQHAAYGPIRDRIIGQIFDSAVDYDGIPSGMPKALTKNVFLQKTMEAYMNFHMKVFRESADKHYLMSSQEFHNNSIQVPSLFLFSKDDPVGTAKGNLRVIRKWEARGVPVSAKCWESSPHVSHMHHHPDEYLEELTAHLERIGLLAEPYRRASKV